MAMDCTRVLVTGATGFIGSAVVRALRARDVPVRALVRSTSNQDNLKGLGVEVVAGDLQDRQSLDRAVAGCQQLYHVAAHYALWAQDPSVFYAINVDGTKHLLDAAAQAGVGRVVYTSTIGTIGLPCPGELATETTPISAVQFSGDYKRSKFLAEQAVLTLAQAGFPVVIVNPSAPVGAHDVKPTPTGQVILDFMRGRMWAYLDTGMNIIDVEDVAIGHLNAMERGRIGERYILGHRNVSLRQLFGLLSEITGVKAPSLKLPRGLVLPLAYLNKWMADYVTHRSPRIPLEGVKMAKYYMHYDSTKAIRELALPQTPIEHALEQAVRWFRAHGYA